MKTKNRVLVAVVLCLAMLTPMFAATAVAVEPTENAALNIIACNLVFGNEVVVKYAIDGTQENARLLVWTAPQASYTVNDSPVATLTPKSSTVDEAPATVFNFDGFNASQMTDSIYTRVYDVATGEYGAVHKYSIIQYAYSMLGLLPGSTASEDENLKAMLTKMLEYGATAQTYFNNRAEYPAGDDTYVAVTVSGGTLADGFSGGLFHKDESISLTAPATDASGNPFSYWKNENESTVATEREAVIKPGTNCTLTPVYGQIVPEISNPADFNTMTLNTKYGERVSTDGWVANNAAVIHTGDEGFVGTDATAVCLNGKVGAAGTLTSPVVLGGIKSLSFNYGLPFSDNKFSITINIKQNGVTVATTTLEETGVSQDTANLYEWVLTTPVEGNFTIEIVNNCLSNSSSNKDRLSIWNLSWVNA